MGLARPVLHVGDRVIFDGDEHQVVGLSGTLVRLRADSGVQQVVLAGHLMAAADFTVLDAPTLSSVVPHGLLEALPAEAVSAAERWREHVVEVETGLSPDPPAGARPRKGYDPAMTSLAERQLAKAAELGVSVRTIEGKRARYAAQGLWGLVDQRVTRTFDIAGQAALASRYYSHVGSVARIAGDLGRLCIGGASAHRDGVGAHAAACPAR